MSGTIATGTPGTPVADQGVAAAKAFEHELPMNAGMVNAPEVRGAAVLSHAGLKNHGTTWGCPSLEFHEGCEACCTHGSDTM